jgi:hypothetical protein
VGKGQRYYGPNNARMLTALEYRYAGVRPADLRKWNRPGPCIPRPESVIRADLEQQLRQMLNRFPEGYAYEALRKAFDQSR